MNTKKKFVLVFLFSTSRNSINLSKNYYSILEVDIGCDQKTIKKSYLKLVKMHHPDINVNGKQKFTQVQEAYEVLSNPQLKSYYDQNSQSHNGRRSNNSTQNASKPYTSSYSQQSQSKSGHTYYTYRTYKSEDYKDYFYEESFKTKQNSQKRANNSHQAYQRFKQQQKNKQNQKYKNQTEQQKKIRDKLRAMRGFTCPHNVMWNRSHLRYTELMQEKEKVNKNEEALKNMMPEKVRKFYDKIMKKIQQIV